MIAMVITIQIMPGRKDAFLEATLEDARVSTDDEPTCLRYDVLQDNEDPNRIHLYEVYTDAAAREAIRQSPHFIKWQETVKDWFDGPLVRRITTPVYPFEGAWG